MSSTEVAPRRARLERAKRQRDEQLDEVLDFLAYEFRLKKHDLYDLAKRIKTRWPRTKGGQAGSRRMTVESIATRSATTWLKLQLYFARKRAGGRNLPDGELEKFVAATLKKYPAASEEQLRADSARSWSAVRKRRNKGVG